MSKIKDWLLRQQEIDSQGAPDMDGPDDTREMVDAESSESLYPSAARTNVNWKTV